MIGTAHAWITVRAGHEAPLAVSIGHERMRTRMAHPHVRSGRCSAPVLASAARLREEARMGFFVALLVNGILAGALYALMALAFVVVYKATGRVQQACG
jgi:hypothetical protein